MVATYRYCCRTSEIFELTFSSGMTPTKNAPRPTSTADQNDSVPLEASPPSLFPDVRGTSKAPKGPLAACPSPRHLGRQRIELVPRVDQMLRDIANAIGLPPRGVLGHLLIDLSQRIRLRRPLVDGAPEAPDLLGGRDQTMVLRYIPITRTGKHHLRRWTEAHGTGVSVLITRRLRQVDDHLPAGRPTDDDPVQSYQRLLDVLYERPDDAEEDRPPAS